MAIGDRTSSPPVSEPDPPPQTGNGSGHPAFAGDDNYQLDGGKTFYFNTGYLTMNDKGADGGLRVVSLDAATERGGTVAWWLDGSFDICTILLHVHDTIG
jgi:hypothetical protein